jgi:hypothetical protein
MGTINNPAKTLRSLFSAVNLLEDSPQRKEKTEFAQGSCDDGYVK